MEKIKIYYRGRPLCEYPLGDRPLALGSDGHCDIVVHDPEAADHHWLVVPRRGTVVAYDLAKSQNRRAEERHLPLNQRLALGRDFELTRVFEPERRAGLGSEPRTELVAPLARDCAKLTLLIGTGGDARQIRIDGAPVDIGSAADNDLRLSDRAVSAKHCRLEPADFGLVVRDLGSSNGTYVNGVRVIAALVGEGAQLRVGHTDLRVVARGGGASRGAAGMVAQSSAMLQILAEVQRLAALSWPVLVVGESGTGKEHIARSLHQAGPRRSGRFVALNAGGLPRELIESELFGHERGAFTGAASGHKGVFEQADGGTLFLDEIGELPLDMQARLLRIVESGEIRRVGAESQFQVDVRLVCATHRNLRAMVAEGKFRHDLYYRLARLVIEVPPLRSRPEDIPALATHFLDRIAAEMGPRQLSQEALSRLLGYGWPGNARELYNVLSAACAATASGRLDAGDIERAFGRVCGSTAAFLAGPEVLRQAVQNHGGNLSAAARALGMARTTLRDRLKALDEENKTN